MVSRNGILLALSFGMHFGDSLLGGLLEEALWAFAHSHRAADKLKHSV